MGGPTGMSYFRNRHQPPQPELVRKNAHGLQPYALFWKTAGFLLQLIPGAGLGD